MFNPKRTCIAKLRCQSIVTSNLDSRATIITLRPLHHATTGTNYKNVHYFLCI